VGTKIKGKESAKENYKKSCAAAAGGQTEIIYYCTHHSFSLSLSLSFYFILLFGKTD
jgi:hypothetical protein